MALMTMWIATGMYLPVRSHTLHRILPFNDKITLAATYGYRPEEIVVLKDQPDLLARYQPTRVNMVRDIMSSPLRDPC